MNIKEYIAASVSYLLVGDWSRIAARAKVTTQTVSRMRSRETLSEMTQGERRAFDAYVYYVKLRQKQEANMATKAKRITPKTDKP